MVIRPFFLYCTVWILLNYAQYNYASTKTKIKKCDDEFTESDDGIASWKYKGVRYTTSEDSLCWKESGELVLRECNTNTGKWIPESVKCKVQKNENKYCPEDLLELQQGHDEPICIKISNVPQSYEETFCYGSNVVITEDLSTSESDKIMSFLLTNNISQYWLPFKRNNGSSTFTVRLPGNRWKKVFDKDVQTTDLRSDKNCLSVRYTNTKIERGNKNNEAPGTTVEITHCETPLHSVCVFKKHFLASTGCEEGFGALSYRPNECYGVNWNNQVFAKTSQIIEVPEYFGKRNIIRLILSDFAPKKRKDEFFKIGSFGDEFEQKYVVAVNNEQRVRVILKNPEAFLDLSKYVMDSRLNTVEMILKMDTEKNKLDLLVYHRKFLWHIEDKHFGVQCFTNADYELIRSTSIDLIWENEELNKAMFRVKLQGDGTGEYWCEGHTIFNFQHVTSNRLIATNKRRGHAFAMRMNVTCKAQNEDFCTNIDKHAKQFGKNIRKLLRKESEKNLSGLVIHSARIMDVERITGLSIVCWAHVAASLKRSAVDNSEEESSEEDNSSEDNERIRHDTSVRMHVLELLKQLNLNQSESKILTVRSTEFCFPEKVHVNNNVQTLWMQAVRGQAATTEFLCLRKNGMPFTRQCAGDFLHGAQWQDLAEAVVCDSKLKNTETTKSLYDLENSNMVKSSPGKVVQTVRKIIKENQQNLGPADIHFTSNIIQASIKSLSELNLIQSNAMLQDILKNTAIWKNATRDFMVIYNYLIDVRTDIIKMSARLNSTNKLLEALENAMDMQSSLPFADENSIEEDEPNLNFKVLDYLDIGVSVKISKYLLYFLIDPSIANISGIALFHNNNSLEDTQMLPGAFENEHYRFLQWDHVIEDFIHDPNLQLGTYVPMKLLRRLNTLSIGGNTTRKSPIVVIKVYSNDKLFQQLNPQSHRVPGRVVSISLPGYKSDLPESLPLVFRKWGNKQLNNSAEFCNYWDYNSWAADGITFSEHSEKNVNVVLCLLTHLTPFAYLVGYNFTVNDDIEVSISTVHDKAMDIITVTGCSLSLLGISGIFITAAVFHSWRRKASSKVLLQLSAAIALQMIILCFVNTQQYSLHLVINKIVPSCVAIGACLHYSILVQFFWMMVIAYLQFKRYVQVFGETRPKRFFLKATSFCWGVPLLPVILVILLDHDSFTKGDICYPSGNSLYFGIIMPVTAIIVANFVIFCFILYNILRSPATPIRHTDKPMLLSQIRLSILLFFLLGFTWCFGLLSAMKASIVFPYLFCLTATLQGFVIFIYFIILDPVTRRMWRDFFSKMYGNRKSEIDSFKDTTQTY